MRQCSKKSFNLKYRLNSIPPNKLDSLLGFICFNHECGHLITLSFFLSLNLARESPQFFFHFPHFISFHYIYLKLSKCCIVFQTMIAWWDSHTHIHTHSKFIANNDCVFHLVLSINRVDAYYTPTHNQKPMPMLKWLGC